ncbi:hypothetical protein [Streptomyces chiangmaiensis]|uniref:DUF8017 domain-containing protein n=1 Tax=Streptomyces chiangmaiensis TaxID=766497 RepID=A0ABU7FEC5_9ACTN|nr:hypothetical protein [Streptomyces chiangmaiensis]MED7822250.1 hypothetical protein [Streptomyces chiangmaiensis]
MWPGEQPPGGEQNPQNQNPYQQPGYQQPNPYQQPGYQQPNPYQQPGRPQWGPPTPVGAPQPPGGGGGRQTKVVAIVAAAAVVVTAGVTAFLVLGGNKDGKAAGDDAKASASASRSATASASAPGNPRSGESEKPTVPGWKVVVNPKWGTAFDVPPEWDVKSPGLLIGFEDDNPKADGKPLITMSAPAFLKEKWCTSDDDKDGRTEDKALAGAGTKGASGAKTTDEVAVNQVAWWVFGGYTQPDKKSITFDQKAKPYTTASGIEGSIAWARSKNTPKKGKCASDGKAVTFGLKNSAGDFVAWSLYGATGVKEEVPDSTILKILSTVRLHGDPTAS